jgi:hypothetical protein
VRVDDLDRCRCSQALFLLGVAGRAPAAATTGGLVDAEALGLATLKCRRP